MFDSSNYEEEEDEDYSLKEDLRQNPNAYKEEDEFNLRKKFVVPKSEVDDLIQDLRNPLPMVTASMDPKSAHQA